MNLLVIPPLCWMLHKASAFTLKIYLQKYIKNLKNNCWSRWIRTETATLSERLEGNSHSTAFITAKIKKKTHQRPSLRHKLFLLHSFLIKFLFLQLSSHTTVGFFYCRDPCRPTSESLLTVARRTKKNKKQSGEAATTATTPAFSTTR